jgi:uncharacterized protein HemX
MGMAAGKCGLAAAILTIRDRVSERENKMRTILSMMAVLLALSVATAHAATEQQNKMATCNKEATGKKGDERKAFMKDCLSKKPAEDPKPAMNSQQSKMATCNKEATGKKGDERKKFMSECLKAK